MFFGKKHVSIFFSIRMNTSNVKKNNGGKARSFSIISARYPSKQKTKVCTAFASRRYFGSAKRLVILPISVTHRSLAAWDISVVELPGKKRTHSF